MSIFYILSANNTHARLFLKQHNQLQALRGWTCIRGKVHNRYLVSAPAPPARKWCNTLPKAEPAPPAQERPTNRDVPVAREAGRRERPAAGFARHIAVELEKFRHQNPLGNLVVVAAPEFMALLSQFLNPATRSQITCTIAKDKSLHSLDEINARAELLWESLVCNFTQHYQR